MTNNEEKIKIMNQIKTIQRIINFGYDRALLYADKGEEEDFTKTFENKSRIELFQDIKSLKAKIYIKSNREKSPYDKFCIGKCKKEFIPKDGNIEIYCSSCDRTIAKRPMRK